MRDELIYLMSLLWDEKMFKGGVVASRTRRRLLIQTLKQAIACWHGYSRGRSVGTPIETMLDRISDKFPYAHDLRMMSAVLMDWETGDNISELCENDVKICEDVENLIHKVVTSVVGDTAAFSGMENLYELSLEYYGLAKEDLMTGQKTVNKVIGFQHTYACLRYALRELCFLYRKTPEDANKVRCLLNELKSENVPFYTALSVSLCCIESWENVYDFDDIGTKTVTCEEIIAIIPAMFNRIRKLREAAIRDAQRWFNRIKTDVRDEMFKTHPVLYEHCMANSYDAVLHELLDFMDKH